MEQNKKQQLDENLIAAKQVFLIDKEDDQDRQDLSNAVNIVQSEQKKKRESCCGVFSLQTGVLMIIGTDVFIFIILASMTGMMVENFEFTTSNENKLGFTLMSDGVVLLLFGIRMLFGWKYAQSVLFPPNMDYQYILEFGKLKWHTKRVKNMRICFKNYALASNVSSVFIFIQTLVLFLVLYSNTNMYFRYIFLLLLSVFTLVNLRTVYSHLDELDQ